MSQALVVNVWWYVPEVSIPAQNMEKALVANGFAPDTIKPVSRKKTVSRAVRSFQDRRHSDGRQVAEKVGETMTSVVYGILDHTRPNVEQVRYEQSTTVRFDKESGRVETNGSLASEVELAIQKFSNCYTDDDIRGFLLDVIQKNFGRSARPSGGIYFVPESNMEEILRAKKVLETVNSGAKFYVQRVMNGQEERQTLNETIVEDVGSEIANIISAVQNIERRIGAVSTQANRVKELNDLVLVYQGLLGEEARFETLIDGIRDAEKAVADKMAEMKDSRNQPKSDGRIKSGEILDKIAGVLEGTMHYREITIKLAENGEVLPGDAPRIQSNLRQAVLDGDARFKKVGRGYFAKA